MPNQHFLPSILQDQALYLGSGGSNPPYRVPRPYRTWLLDRGSLTRRLIHASDGAFRVKLLRQGHQMATDHEREALQLQQRSWPFLREVALLCHEQPWVFARTVIPVETLQGPARALTRLGSKPLGAVLFNHPHVRRGPIAVYRLDAARVSQDFAGQGSIWGRQSVFYLYDKPLLVSEYFLHDCPMYANGSETHSV
ncbi:MAG: chorismate lyase [Ketobacter sp.]|nr:chorismate lyase [Ketobacter sp.]